MAPAPIRVTACRRLSLFRFTSNTIYVFQANLPVRKSQVTDALGLDALVYRIGAKIAAASDLNESGREGGVCTDFVPGACF